MTSDDAFADFKFAGKKNRLNPKEESAPSPDMDVDYDQGPALSPLAGPEPAIVKSDSPIVQAPTASNPILATIVGTY